MINRNLLNPHDIIVIGAITIIAHFTLLPLYNIIAKKVLPNAANDQ